VLGIQPGVASMAIKRNATTVDRILDEAEKLVQVRGFNAFSYADISKAVGIQKASLHHHFATKTDLGVALVDRYRRAFGDALEGIESNGTHAVERLERYVDLYRSVLRKRRMCMCGMLAADVATLPGPIRDGVAEFFSENVSWLTRVLTEGKKRGELSFVGSAASTSAFIVSSLEGAMLVARGRGELDHLDEVAGFLLATLRVEKRKPRVAKGK
jgi:TetR/AcrR family transcriptional repressor of nem operon